jgi:superfamily II DNA or RNA helicase
MTGRGLRPFPGKTDCLLLDLRGVSHVLGRPDEDRVYSLDGEGIALTRQPAGTRLCAVCGTPLAVGQVICPDPECGHRNALEIPKATGEALVDWREHAKKDPPDKRVEFLVRQIRTARSRGWKKGAVGMRFRARYGYWPDGMLMETAKRRAG